MEYEIILTTYNKKFWNLHSDVRCTGSPLDYQASTSNMSRIKQKFSLWYAFGGKSLY